MRGVALMLLILCISSCFLLTNANGRGENIILWYVMNITGGIAFPLFISLEGFRYAIGFSFSRKALLRCVFRFLDYVIFYFLFSAFFFLVKWKQPNLFPFGGPEKLEDVLFRTLPGLFPFYLVIFYMVLFLPLLIVFRLADRKLRDHRFVVFVLLAVFCVLFLFVGLWTDRRYTDLQVYSFEFVKLARFSVFFMLGILLAFFIDFHRKPDATKHGAMEEEAGKAGAESNKKRIFTWIPVSLFALAGIILFSRYHLSAGFTPLFRLPVYGLLIMFCFWPLSVFLRNRMLTSRTLALLGRFGCIEYYALLLFSGFFVRLIGYLHIESVWLSFPLFFLLNGVVLYLIALLMGKWAERGFPERKKVYVAIGRCLPAVFFLFSLLLLLTAIWMVTSWSELTMDEVIFHIVAPAEGTAKNVITGYILRGVLPTAAVLVLVVFILVKTRKNRRIQKWVNRILSFTVPVLLIACWVLLDQKMDIRSYLKSQFTSEDFIRDNYVDPNEVELTFPEKKRNIIFIFLESMETTFADEENGGAFPENLIPGLTKVAEEEGVSFSGPEGGLNGGYVTAATGFTSGAMFGMTSGLPLKVDIYANDMVTQDSFFPNITCIGDITQKNGYRNSILMGSHATLGGRKLMYDNHGVSRILDLDYYQEIGRLPSDYYVWWGFEDEKLFQYAKEELTTLSKSDEPFMFSMLTADTHFEDGYVCELCDNRFGDNRYANVFSCSDRQVTAFLDWIREQDFYENTTIILCGDHITMDKDFCDDVNPAYDRRFYFTVLNSASDVEVDEKRTFTAMDVFPTTLAAAGVKIEGNRLGLGSNLFSGVKTLPEEMGLDEFKQKITQKSEFLQKYGAIDMTDELLATIQRTTEFKPVDVCKDEFQAVSCYGVDIVLKYRYDTIPGTKGLYLECLQDGKRIGRERLVFKESDAEQPKFKIFHSDLLIPEYELCEGKQLSFRVVYESEKGDYVFYQTNGDQP